MAGRKVSIILLPTPKNTGSYLHKSEVDSHWRDSKSGTPEFVSPYINSVSNSTPMRPPNPMSALDARRQSVPDVNETGSPNAERVKLRLAPQSQEEHGLKLSRVLGSGYTEVKNPFGLTSLRDKIPNEMRSNFSDRVNVDERLRRLFLLSGNIEHLGLSGEQLASLEELLRRILDGDDGVVVKTGTPISLSHSFSATQVRKFCEGNPPLAVAIERMKDGKLSNTTLIELLTAAVGCGQKDALIRILEGLGHHAIFTEDEHKVLYPLRKP